MQELDYSKINPDNLVKFEQELAAAKAELTKLEDTSKESEKLIDNSEEINETDTSDDINQPESKYTEQEQEAMKQGWNPEHDGPNKKSAAQFLKDGSFFKKIEVQNKKIDDLSDTIKALLEHNRKLEIAKYDEGYKKAISDRQRAIEEGNVHGFNAAEEILRQNIQSKQQLEAITPKFNPEQQELLNNFKSRNETWFTKDDAESKQMTELAIAYDQYNLNKGMAQKDSMKEVESIIRLKFPHRFENPKQERASAVTKSTYKTQKSDNLSPQQKWVIQQAQRIDKNFKVDSYINQLKSTGALKDE